eukprot:m.1430130 g.1430130  ORF g.1430130 m.1430130 type:complete len:114 (-) comp25071_c0_seq5:3551-3892(-)
MCRRQHDKDGCTSRTYSRILAMPSPHRYSSRNVTSVERIVYGGYGNIQTTISQAVCNRACGSVYHKLSYLDVKKTRVCGLASSGDHSMVLKRWTPLPTVSTSASYTPLRADTV